MLPGRWGGRREYSGGVFIRRVALIRTLGARRRAGEGWGARAARWETRRRDTNKKTPQVL